MILVCGGVYELQKVEVLLWRDGKGWGRGRQLGMESKGTYGRAQRYERARGDGRVRAYSHYGA